MLVAVLLGNMLIPLWASRARTWRRSLQRTAVAAVLFNAGYLLMIRYGYWSL